MRNIFVLILVCVVTLPLAASKPSDVVKFSKSEVTRLEATFFEDLDDGTLNRFDYYDAFLIVSEVSDMRIFPAYREKLEAIRNNAKRDLSRYQNGDPYVLGEKLLQWLHDNVFSEYYLKSTTASVLIDSGEFNCLSSSVLYAILAEELGLTVHGVSVDQHAFVMVDGPRGLIDVETTTREGFEPGTEKVIANAVVTVPRKNYRNRRTISIPALIALIYTNRISLLQETTVDCNEDLHKYKKGFYFDQNEKIFRENIVACLKSLAIESINDAEYSLANSYITQGKRFAPEQATWQNLGVNMFISRASVYAEKGDYRNAIAVTKEGLQTYPGDRKLLNNIGAYYSSLAIPLMQNDEYTEAIEVLEQALVDLPGDRTVTANLRAAYANQAVVAYQSGDYAKTLILIEAGLKRFPNESKLTQLKASTVQAIKGEYYNRAVVAFNSGNYRKAITETEKGLSTGGAHRSMDARLRDLKQKAEAAVR